MTQLIKRKNAKNHHAKSNQLSVDIKTSEDTVVK